MALPGGYPGVWDRVEVAMALHRAVEAHRASAAWDASGVFLPDEEADVKKACWAADVEILAVLAPDGQALGAPPILTRLAVAPAPCIPDEGPFVERSPEVPGCAVEPAHWDAAQSASAAAESRDELERPAKPKRPELQAELLPDVRAQPVLAEPVAAAH
jgi:hypothetical protein